MTLSQAQASAAPHADSRATDTQPVTQNDTWKVNLLYDGDCPLCLREVNFLQKKDAGRDIIKFTDISDLDYSPEENGGVDFETAMGRIHAVLADGSVVKNVEVFRQVYSALGIGWIYAATKWPVIGPIVNKIYDIWADKRLAITGRPSLKAVMAERQQKIECETEGRCRLEDM